MIKLKNKQIDLNFECKIVGYEFPDNEQSEWDSNWCLVNVNLSQKQNTFDRTDPSLSTYALIEIRDWFRSLYENKIPYSTTISFTEPCIEFRLLGRNEEGVRIIIELNCELKPPFKLTDYLCHGGTYLGEYDEQEEAENWDMVFTLTNDDFKRILTDLDETIANYPVRK